MSRLEQPKLGVHTKYLRGQEWESLIWSIESVSRKRAPSGFGSESRRSPTRKRRLAVRREAHISQPIRYRILADSVQSVRGEQP